MPAPQMTLKRRHPMTRHSNKLIGASALSLMLMSGTAAQIRDSMELRQAYLGL